MISRQKMLLFCMAKMKSECFVFLWTQARSIEQDRLILKDPIWSCEP